MKQVKHPKRTPRLYNAQIFLDARKRAGLTFGYQKFFKNFDMMAAIYNSNDIFYCFLNLIYGYC
ncbi:hypothetical protein EEL33_01695 [Muribaculaceae bacterium Isolate-037 (Harlan)]|nr:hypothetical protein EEL33_01695 [Muribaculaceae bacterium Isolate-037 (Harlan)]